MSWFGLLIGLDVGLSAEKSSFLALLSCGLASALRSGPPSGRWRMPPALAADDLSSDHRLVAARYELLVGEPHAERAAELFGLAAGRSPHERIPGRATDVTARPRPAW